MREESLDETCVAVGEEGMNHLKGLGEDIGEGKGAVLSGERISFKVIPGDERGVGSVAGRWSHDIRIAVIMLSPLG